MEEHPTLHFIEEYIEYPEEDILEKIITSSIPVKGKNDFKNYYG